MLQELTGWDCVKSSGNCILLGGGGGHGLRVGEGGAQDPPRRLRREARGPYADIPSGKISLQYFVPYCINRCLAVAVINVRIFRSLF